MAAYFSAENIERLWDDLQEVHRLSAELLGRYVSRPYRNGRAREYASHGFCRRLGTLVRAIDLVYEALPPEQEDIPERDNVLDATIAIQSFVLNAFGCLDNLAWIWVYERDVEEVRGKDGTIINARVGLGKKYDKVRRSFSDEFRDYLDSRETWFGYLTDFRDALAHRIPLYIPPYIVTPQNEAEYNRLEQASGEARTAARFRDTFSTPI